MKYKRYRLDDLLEIKYGKDKKAVESEDGKYPIFGTGGLMGYANNFLYDQPSILIGRKGTINKVKYVDGPFWTVDTLFWTKINNEIVDPKYLYYRLLSINFNDYNEGTTIPSLRTETLNRIEIEIPDLETQKKTVRILSTLDQKIELNNQENKNLEAICEHLYKETIKNNNCNKTTIGDYSKAVITGGTPSTKNELFWGGNIPFVTIPDMHNKVFIANTERTITEAGVNKSKITPKGSTIVSCIATVGLVSVAPLECQTNQQINSVVPKNLFDTYFLYETLKNKTEVLKAIGSTGSATLNVNKTAFSNVEIQIPSQEVIEQYHIRVSPLFEKIYKNEAENLTIVYLRDNLLPKLISGEISLENVSL